MIYFFIVSKPVKEEVIGGKYNAKLIVEGKGKDVRGLEFEYGEIVYTKDGIEHRGYYNSYLKKALNWIKANTPENSTFLCWWEYGHMIVGYAERESVIKNPSAEALIYLTDKSKIKELDPNEKIVDVARALTTTDENTTKAVMEKYGASYILVTLVDGSPYGYWIFKLAGLNHTDYFRPVSPFGEGLILFRSEDYTELGKQTIIYKLLTDANMQFLHVVYSDEMVKIFKISK
jgi:asparagine N-glycosylation enzyme membrane subunit Stt3